MDYVSLIFIILLGLSIGSFINVCIYRIPRKLSIVKPASACTNCGYKLKPYDLIPVFSYIFLKGRCRNCHEKISPRYMIVEILTAAVFSLLYVNVPSIFKFVIFAAISSILIMILFIDLEHMIIPDGLNLIIGILGLALNLIFPENGYYHTILNMLFGFLLGGIMFFIFAYLGAMGGGDIKLMAALGLVFGWKLTLLVMFLSFLLGGIVGISLVAFKIKKMKDMIPFGPYISAASIIVFLYGSLILNWYLSRFV